MGKQVNVRMSKSGSLLGLSGIGIRMEGDERMGAGRGNNIEKQALHDNITELCQDTFYTFTYTLIHSFNMLLCVYPPPPFTSRIARHLRFNQGFYFFFSPGLNDCNKL